MAILIDDELKMLVECKSVKTKLNSNHLNQLFRYYSVSDCKIAILTNGVDYWFFTDSVNPGRMDSEAFLKLNIINDDLSILEIFSREKFSDEKIENLVGELKYKTLIREKLLSEFSYPSQDFVTLIAKEVSSERITAKKRRMFKKLITEELETILANVVLDYRDRQNPIITTPEEVDVSILFVRYCLKSLTLKELLFVIGKATAQYYWMTIRIILFVDCISMIWIT